MKVNRFIFNLFGVNTYVVWDPESREAAIIDPGMINEEEINALNEFIDREQLKPVMLLNTHSHLDHIFGNKAVKDKYGLSVQAHIADKALANDIDAQARRFGGHYSRPSVGIDVELRDGQKLHLGSEVIDVISVPGHSEGSVAFYFPESKFVITGDALFAGSIGRTDLPGGNHDKLINAIRCRLMSLPDDTVILPGHGGESTIGRESAFNPYLQ